MGGEEGEEVARLRAENIALRKEVSELRGQRIQEPSTSSSAADPIAPPSPSPYCPGHELSPAQVSRYSRQLLLESFGIQGQSNLCKGSVLIVGAGGLGSPAALYLAGCGVGRLGIVDKDVVELSNLHRQIIHREDAIGHHKADSAALAALALNSSITVDVHREGISPANAVDLVRSYDCVLDCSDNPATRYLVSDACVAADRPLVSGAAIGTDGQLTVYHHGSDGPCYRCLFPVAPLPENCSRCSDHGVLGVVPGIIGTLQALEAVKVISGKGEPLSKRLLVFDALQGSFRQVKLRPRKADCPACGEQPSVLPPSNFDYETFTQGALNDSAACGLSLLKPDQRISPGELHADLIEPGQQPPYLLDIRPPHEYSIASLPGSVNIPLKELQSRMDEVRHSAASGTAVTGGVANGSLVGPRRVVVYCRRGNDSQIAVEQLEAAGITGAVDVVGGLEGWHSTVDCAFPVY
eukprot:CAMPEP_0117658236 /NCGR_PEP_ID=MMETSP0804-20121206/5758_1 /TAXON_ID=1074897 /ORGANISM="Tetraselmis astigmatica, Strain CCMP880" /LENGTH=465 /DNA_ID=CAMNT_0005464747 /DNA_START=57 /DNA_END=1454 /DNA_ORIENTATION=-